MSDEQNKGNGDQKQQTADPVLRFPIVGLGASAGGIKALHTFFEGMPQDSGMGFVVVMHLSSEFKSNLAQVLQQRTSMPVVQVNEAMQIAPNHVYVIPPGKHLLIKDSMLNLVEPQQPTGKRVAIDLFFRTLASAFGQRAVSIVLSGVDSDGVIGIKHIKEQGGVTIVQDPTEAEYDSMPRAAIATGMVDWVLPVAKMPPQLLEFLHNEKRMQVPPEETAPESGETDAGNSGGPLLVQHVPSATDEEALVEALRFLRSQTGHDFAHYKRATVLRRVARRLQVNLLENIASYLDFLRTHPTEVTALLHDLLISVTNFFRDPEAFAALESQIPQLFAGKQAADQVRAWVVGCATGEEAYSIAILLSEYASRLDAPPAIQVFATDLDEGVIQAARSGVYPSTIEADVSQERLRRFFQKDHGRYRIKKEIRELVLFSAHNVLKDSHFSRLDLITCRNLLIYLKREAQDGVYDIFHFALRPGGLLFLGGSENLDDSHPQFVPIDKPHRIYVRRTVGRTGWQIPALPVSSTPRRALDSPVIPRPVPQRFLPSPPDAQAETAAPAAAFISPPQVLRPLHFGELHFAMLEHFAPPSVIVNSAYDIMHLSERVGQFLEFPGGDASVNLLKVVHPSLRMELRTALFRAAKERTDITAWRVPFSRDDKPRPVNIRVRPAHGLQEAEGFLLVLFEPAEAEEAASDVPAPKPIAYHLEDEVRHLREQLSATVEQYEASLEELKASNEELQALNEEMRSAAEELETSKEELQSINEELMTVNQELKSSVEELSRANSDLQNLMASTEIGTIFLDRQLHVKRFTPRIQELFNLIPTDIGRPLSDITHKLNYPALTEDADRVLRDLHSSERELASDGHWFLGRMLPYRTLEDRIDGVVLTFVDITSRKRAEEVRIGLQKEVAVLAERNRMAQELHDTLAQGFTAIKLQIDAAVAALPDEPDEANTYITRAREIARQSLIEARRSVHGLHSQLIDEGSLSSAFQQLADRANNGIKVQFLTEGTGYALPPEVESGLYRIGQEALTNALLHAQPRNILLELHYAPAQVRLRIHDDGLGFELHEGYEGLGIVGMQERASRIGGKLGFVSQPGQGTEVTLTLPTPGTAAVLSKVGDII